MTHCLKDGLVTVDRTRFVTACEQFVAMVDKWREKKDRQYYDGFVQDFREYEARKARPWWKKLTFRDIFCESLFETRGVNEPTFEEYKKFASPYSSSVHWEIMHMFSEEYNLAKIMSRPSFWFSANDVHVNAKMYDTIMKYRETGMDGVRFWFEPRGE